MKIIGIIILILAGILFLAIVVLGVLRIVDDSRVNRIRSSLQVSEKPEGGFSPEMVEVLPDVAQRYLLHAIQPGTPLARRVELKMSGTIKPRDDASWMPLQATQILTPGRGFIWKAKAKASDLISMHVTHYYADGKGRMHVALLCNSLKIFESNRDKYPTFQDFLPEIIHIFKNLNGYRQVPISKASHKIVRLQFWKSETTKP